MEFYGLKSSNSSVGAKIVAETAEEWGSSSNDYPTELQFHTTNNGTTDGLTQRMVIDQKGFVGIGTTLQYKFHVKENDNIFHPLMKLYSQIMEFQNYLSS